MHILFPLNESLSNKTTNKFFENKDSNSSLTKELSLSNVKKNERLSNKTRDTFFEDKDSNLDISTQLSLLDISRNESSWNETKYDFSENKERSLNDTKTLYSSNSISNTSISNEIRYEFVENKNSNWNATKESGLSDETRYELLENRSSDLNNTAEFILLNISKNDSFSNETRNEFFENADSNLNATKENLFSNISRNRSVSNETKYIYLDNKDSNLNVKKESDFFNVSKNDNDNTTERNSLESHPENFNIKHEREILSSSVSTYISLEISGLNQKQIEKKSTLSSSTSSNDIQYQYIHSSTNEVYITTSELLDTKLESSTNSFSSNEINVSITSIEIDKTVTIDYDLDSVLISSENFDKNFQTDYLTTDKVTEYKTTEDNIPEVVTDRPKHDIKDLEALNKSMKSKSESPSNDGYVRNQRKTRYVNYWKLEKLQEENMPPQNIEIKRNYNDYLQSRISSNNLNQTNMEDLFDNLIDGKIPEYISTYNSTNRNSTYLKEQMQENVDSKPITDDEINDQKIMSTKSPFSVINDHNAALDMNSVDHLLSNSSLTSITTPSIQHHVHGVIEMPIIHYIYNILNGSFIVPEKKNNSGKKDNFDNKKTPEARLPTNKLNMNINTTFSTASTDVMTNFSSERLTETNSLLNVTPSYLQSISSELRQNANYSSTTSFSTITAKPINQDLIHNFQLNATQTKTGEQTYKGSTSYDTYTRSGSPSKSTIGVKQAVTPPVTLSLNHYSSVPSVKDIFIKSTHSPKEEYKINSQNRDLNLNETEIRTFLNKSNSLDLSKNNLNGTSILTHVSNVSLLKNEIYDNPNKLKQKVFISEDELPEKLENNIDTGNIYDNEDETSVEKYEINLKDLHLLNRIPSHRSTQGASSTRLSIFITKSNTRKEIPLSDTVTMHPIYRYDGFPAEKSVASQQNILPIVLPVVFSIIITSMILFLLIFRSKKSKHKKKIKYRSQKIKDAENYIELVNNTDLKLENQIYSERIVHEQNPCIVIENENCLENEKKRESTIDFIENEFYEDSPTLKADDLNVECYDEPWDSMSSLHFANSLLNLKCDENHETPCNEHDSVECRERTITELTENYEYLDNSDINSIKKNSNECRERTDTEITENYEYINSPDMNSCKNNSSEYRGRTDTEITENYEYLDSPDINSCRNNSLNIAIDYNENAHGDYENPYDMKNSNNLFNYEAVNEALQMESFEIAPPIPLTPRPSLNCKNGPPPIPNSPRPSSTKQATIILPRAPLPPSPLSSNYCSEDEYEVPELCSNKDEVEYYTSPLDSNSNINDNHDYDQVYVSNRNSAIMEQLLDKNNYLKRPHRSGTGDSNAYEEITFPHHSYNVEIPLPPRERNMSYEDELEMDIPIYEDALASLKPIAPSEITHLLSTSRNAIIDQEIYYIDHDQQFNPLDSNIPTSSSFSTLDSRSSSSEKLSENQSIDIDVCDLRLLKRNSSQSNSIIDKAEVVYNTIDKDDIYETVEF